MDSSDTLSPWSALASKKNNIENRVQATKPMLRAGLRLMAPLEYVRKLGTIREVKEITNGRIKRNFIPKLDRLDKLNLFTKNILAFSLLIGILVFSHGKVLAQESQPSSDPRKSSFWQNDKVNHAAGSAALSSSFYALMRKNGLTRWESFVTSASLIFILSSSKEVFDSKLESDDLRADMIGCAVGSGLTISIDLIAF